MDAEGLSFMVRWWQTGLTYACKKCRAEWLKTIPEGERWKFEKKKL